MTIGHLSVLEQDVEGHNHRPGHVHFAMTFRTKLPIADGEAVTEDTLRNENNMEYSDSRTLGQEHQRQKLVHMAGRE